MDMESVLVDGLLVSGCDNFICVVPTIHLDILSELCRWLMADLVSLEISLSPSCYSDCYYYLKSCTHKYFANLEWRYEHKGCDLGPAVAPIIRQRSRIKCLIFPTEESGEGAGFDFQAHGCCRMGKLPTELGKTDVSITRSYTCLWSLHHSYSVL